MNVAVLQVDVQHNTSLHDISITVLYYRQQNLILVIPKYFHSLYYCIRVLPQLL